MRKKEMLTAIAVIVMIAGQAFHIPTIGFVVYIIGGIYTTMLLVDYYSIVKKHVLPQRYGDGPLTSEMTTKISRLIIKEIIFFGTAILETVIISFVPSEAVKPILYGLLCIALLSVESRKMNLSLKVSVLVSVLLIVGTTIIWWSGVAINHWEKDTSFRYYIHAYLADYIFSEEKEESRYKLVDKWIDQARLVSDLREEEGDILLSEEDIIATQHQENESFVYDTGKVLMSDDSIEYAAWMITLSKFRIHGNYTLIVEVPVSSELTFCAARYRTLTGEGYDYYIEPVTEDHYMIPVRKGVASLKNIIFFQTAGNGSPEPGKQEVTIEFANQANSFTIEKQKDKKSRSVSESQTDQLLLHHPKLSRGEEK